MSVRIIHGEVPQSLLKCGVSPSVAWLAECQEIAEGVGCAVIPVEKTVWANMVNVGSKPPAVPTSSTVSASGLALLRLPVRSAIAAIAVDVLRMKGADTVRVPACARAVFPLSCFVGGLASGPGENRATSDAPQFDATLEFCARSSVLALRGARSTAPVLQSGWRYQKRRFAGLAVDRDLAARVRHAPILQGCAS